LIFKERFCEKTVFLSSAALSAAEKRDYEHCFAVRQQLFYKLRCDCGVHLPSLTARPNCSTPPAPLPLPRRVAVSAKEA
ncbi:hypothetical protein, partial [Burkholderia ubonensis]|uniref:hypothetical protein n=1 Tax=Burkholderia ubonensis TaxID=101571 RepID=UPI001E446A8B